MISTLVALLITASGVLTACEESEMSLPSEPPENDMEVIAERVDSREENFRVVRLADNLEHPWAVAWLPEGGMLITERPGRLVLLDGEDVTQVDGLPDVQARNQGGLLDIALHPDYDDNGWIYFTYSGEVSGGTGTTLARARLSGTRLNDLEILYRQEPGYSPGRHYGSRIVFADDGTLFMTIGDRGAEDPSQDLDDPAGSTLRLNDDGSVPDDNPFVGQNGVRPEIYSYGHRNAQGMVIHPESGVLWQHEHGPRGGDALNTIRPGANYGWPVATYGTTYGTGRSIGIEPHEDPDIEDPLIHWSPTSIAPSGMAFYVGDAFPGWQGDLFVGALAGQHLRRVVVDGEQVTHQETLLEGEVGRIRDVRLGPDGLIYLLTDRSNGGLYRLEPVD